MMRSSFDSPISETSESQSPPVTEKTVPSVVSRDDAYGSNVVVTGSSCVVMAPVLLRPYIQQRFHPMDNLYVADVHPNHRASKYE